MGVSLSLLSATVVLLPSALTANSTAAIGTDCDVISTVTVKAEDRLNIATASNVTLDQVLFANTNITNSRLINPGDVIKIPDSAFVALGSKPLVEPTATRSKGTASTTTVVAGDTLIIIAKEKLGIKLPALLAANPQIKNPNAINVGDVINIPLCNNGTMMAAPVGGKAGKGGKNATKEATTREELSGSISRMRRALLLEAWF